MDFRDVIEGAKGGLEKFAASLPGFKGYKEKEWRREADKLLRGKLADELAVQLRRLNELQLQLVDSGLIEFTDDLGRAIKKLENLMDRIKTATYGYSGFFDAVKVKEKQLDAIYAFDAKLLEQLPKVAEAIDAVGQDIEAGTGIGAGIQKLIKVITALAEQFEKRKEAITAVGEVTQADEEAPAEQ